MERNRTPQRERNTSPDRYLRDSDLMVEDENEDAWSVRKPSSARRYQGTADVRTEVGRVQADVQSYSGQRNYRAGYSTKTPVPPRRTATQTNIPTVQPTRRTISKELVKYQTGVITPTADDDEHKPHTHWLVIVGMVMVTMSVAWIGLNMAGGWWQGVQDDWHYGRPRTSQIDQVVGHNDSLAHPSHFIAINLNRHVEVIEFPGGDATKAKVYIGPTLLGPGQDLAVVTLTFKDVNGDGKPDMLINVQDSHFVFINDNGAFRPARSGEQIQFS